MPSPPGCIPIDKPDDQCWTVCSCMCAWVKALEAKKTMTEEELKAAEEEDKQHYQEVLQVGTVLPAKSDSDVMFVYKFIRDS